MQIKEVIKHFGNQNRLANALGVKRQAITRWVSKDKIPYKRQQEIQLITENKFQAIGIEKQKKESQINRRIPKNCVFNKDENKILDLYKKGLMVTEILEILGYGNYFNLRRFIINRIEINNLQ